MVTIILIAITCLVSLLCFTGTLNANKLLFHAYSIWHRKEWYRMLTYGLLFPLVCRPDIFQHFLAQLGL